MHRHIVAHATCCRFSPGNPDCRRVIENNITGHAISKIKIHASLMGIVVYMSTVYARIGYAFIVTAVLAVIVVDAAFVVKGGEVIRPGLSPCAIQVFDTVKAVCTVANRCRNQKEQQRARK